MSRMIYSDIVALSGDEVRNGALARLEEAAEALRLEHCHSLDWRSGADAIIFYVWTEDPDFADPIGCVRAHLFLS